MNSDVPLAVQLNSKAFHFTRIRVVQGESSIFRIAYNVYNTHLENVYIFL